MTALVRAAVCALVACVPLHAGAAQQAIPAGKVRDGTLSFDGRATVGDFTGSTTTVTGEMTGGAVLADVRGWVEAPVRTLRTGNDRRDRDLDRSMESEKYPTLRFELTGVEPGATAGDTTAVVLRGRFIIHGVTREASLPATVRIRPGIVQVRGESRMNLKDYGIGGLTKMMGMLRMHEEIVLHVDLTFESAETLPRH